MNMQSFLTKRENIWWRQIFILFNFGFSLESHLLEISRTLVASKHERKGPVPMKLVGPTSLNSTASKAGVDYWLGVLWKGHIKRKERSAQLHACVFQSGELCRFVQSFKIQRLLWKREIRWAWKTTVFSFFLFWDADTWASYTGTSLPYLTTRLG